MHFKKRLATSSQVGGIKSRSRLPSNLRLDWECGVTLPVPSPERAPKGYNANCYMMQGFVYG